MMTNANSAGSVSRKSHQTGVCMILLSLLVLPFVGCTDSGNGTGPLTSSLSTPTDAADSENSSTDSSEPPNLDGEEPMDALLSPDGEADAQSSTNVASDPDSTGPEEDTVASLIDAPQNKPAISMAPTPTGAIASLTWQPVSDPKVKGYYVYYGKQSAGDAGACAYDERVTTEDPSVTIAELEPNTPYFFAVSAYGRLESPCSNEATAITPPAGI